MSRRSMTAKCTVARAVPAVAATFVLLFAAPALGQEQDTIPRDSVYDLGPIAVRAVRPSTTPGGVSALTMHLDSVRLRPAPLLEDVLRELPLVQVRTNSRGEAQLALRGAEERQIAILLDGVPLTLGWDHRTDLSVIPMTAARRITVVRGMSSVLHGPNVLGGVVEIGMGSVAGADVEPFEVAAGIDNRGGYSATAHAGTRLDGTLGSLLVRGGVGRREREGLTAPGDAAAVYPALAGGDLRVNSDLEHTDGFLSARLEPDFGGWLSATVSGFEASRGVPPELHEAGPRLWRYPDLSRIVAIVSGGPDPLENGLGVADLDFSVGVDMGSVLVHDFALPADPWLQTDGNAFFRTVAETEEAEDRTVTARVIGSQSLGRGRLRAAATFADITHDEVITTAIGTDSARAEPGAYRQRLWSVAAEAEFPFDVELAGLTGGRVSGGLAYDGSDTPDPGPDVQGAGPTMAEWGGRLGLSAHSGGGGLLLHTAISRRGRFPALREMYSSALGRFDPNPDLRPEILSSVEAGFTTRVGRYDLQMVGFHQRLDDAIVRIGLPENEADPDAPDFRRVNRDQIRSTGMEIITGYTFGRVALEGEVTIQSVEVIEPGSSGVRAEYEPELAGGIGGTAPLLAGVEASAEMEFWGEQFCSAPSPEGGAFERLDSGTRTDLQLSRTFRLGRALGTLQRLGVELAVDNLTDSTVYDQCGLPQPGRTLRLQVRLN